MLVVESAGNFFELTLQNNYFTDLTSMKGACMVRTIFYIGTVMMCAIGTLTGCNNPASEEEGDTPKIPDGVTVIYSDGFGGDLSKWDDHYMITVGDNYPHARITTDAAYSGKYSVTTDSNRTALLFSLLPEVRVESGIAGVQFYIMAKENGQANFTVEIGQNAGSSGGLGKAFGIGFDPNDSIKCKYYDMLGNPSVADTMVAPIQLDHWYKCAIEVNLTDATVSYYIDDAIIRTQALPTIDLMGIDRLLVFRGLEVNRPNYGITTCADGPKQYYADDIVFYKK